jgi:predicted RNA-binding protein YlxR (DUF448 family)
MRRKGGVPNVVVDQSGKKPGRGGGLHQEL